MNAEFPAAMGNRFVTVMRIYDTLIGCLNQAIPGGLAACGAGQSGIIVSSWIDEVSGANRVAVVEPFSGGSGARKNADGVDANDTMIGYLKSTPIEHVESETPLIVRKHELVPGRFGHGRFRGGASVCIELESRMRKVDISARGLDRFRFQPWGVFGGWPGHNSITILNPEKNPQSIGRIKVLSMKQGDVLRMVSSSGAGFGNPMHRDPQLVLRDVLDEMLSESDARTIYGVAISGRSVDESETEALRAGIVAPTHCYSVDYGYARNVYEDTLPAETNINIKKIIHAAPEISTLAC